MFNKNDGTKAFKPVGRLRVFFALPFYIAVLLIVLNIVLYFIDFPAATVMSVFMVFYIAIYLYMQLALKPGIMHDIIAFSSNYSQVQRQLLYELSVPYCLLDTNGRVMWLNKAMCACINKKKDFKKNISTLFPEITANIFPTGEEPKEVRITYEERDYCVEMKRISADMLLQDVGLVESDDKDSFIALYMFDETDVNMYLQKLNDEQFVAGLIYIDNYEEALESIDDVRRSLFIGLIDKRVNKYFATGAAVVRKLEKDKYLAVFRYKYLEKLLADKFSILEDIKSVKIGNEMTLTLSIGIGTGADNYAGNYDLAKAAMDLALRQILDTTDNVLVMGHKLADIDSFGSAIGIYTICRKLGKNVHIVINEVTSSVKPFMKRFIGKDEYPEDLFLLKEEAPEYVDAATVVIVVDVNKPQLTECPELLDKCKTIVVFDHHRQSSDQITGAVLSYVDPYASSASEMITEMIQYVDDNIKIKAFEADALYAGINIDTDGFNSKSGPRTFEAAAFLRRHGADVTRVRKMLRNDMDEYKAVAHAVSRAEVYRDAFAIAIFNGEGLESPTIGGAKAANQLLDISGIKASFVITEYNEKIYISARSIDEVNVQLVMEKLGGGGHMSIAGAQLTGCTVKEAVDTIKETLDNMLAEGEI